MGFAMNDEQRQLLGLVLAGTIGGVILGREAVHHLFVQGLTQSERNGLLKYSALTLAAFGIQQLLEADKDWKEYEKWLMFDSAAEEAYRQFTAGAP